MLFKLVMWLVGFMSDQDKLKVADLTLSEVLASKYYNITPEYAEKIITTVIKSNGNKITDFIVRD